MHNQNCKCYFCRQWFPVSICPKIRTDPTEGPSEYTLADLAEVEAPQGRHAMATGAVDTEELWGMNPKAQREGGRVGRIAQPNRLLMQEPVVVLLPDSESKGRILPILHGLHGADQQAAWRPPPREEVLL